MAKNGKADIKASLSGDGLGVTLQTLFDGMETLVQSKSVVGEPFEAGGAVIIPLLEVSAGLASGALKNNAHNNGAGAMSAKVTPIAMLIIQDGRVRLINIKNQDVFTRLLDLIPEAIDKIKKGPVSEESKEAAVKAFEDTDFNGIEAAAAAAPAEAAEFAEPAEILTDTAEFAEPAESALSSEGATQAEPSGQA